MSHYLIQKAVKTHYLNEEELIILLKDDTCSKELFEAADMIRHRYVGDEVHLRALIEFSNICKNNCYYCGLRRENKNIKRYRLDPELIIDLATHAVTRLGLKTVVLQGGEDLFFDTPKLCFIIRQIKSLGVALTLSIGEKSLEEYKAYKEAGADRFLLRIETTDKALYEKYDPDMSWNARMECLKNIKKAGLEVGSGCLIGLPGQSIESYAKDILFFKELDVDMLGIGPFIPHPETPLNKAAGGTLQTALKVMALSRLLMPDINIPATTAMETIAPEGQIKALKSGANVIMPNITLTQYRKHYELYPGKSNTGYTPDETFLKLKEKIESIGRVISTSYGSHLKKFSPPFFPKIFPELNNV